MPTSLLLEYCQDTIMPNKCSEIGFWSPVKCPVFFFQMSRKMSCIFSDCAGIAVKFCTTPYVLHILISLMPITLISQSVKCSNCISSFLLNVSQQNVLPTINCVITLPRYAFTNITDLFKHSYFKNIENYQKYLYITSYNYIPQRFLIL